jgi:CreA protein
MFKKVIIVLVCIMIAGICMADERVVAKVTTKGWVLANQIEVCAMEDPDIKGITIFYTKTVKKGMIYDEYGTDSSIAVRQTGEISGTIASRDNVFATSSNLFFKTLRINRYYDQASNSLIYLIFTKATDGQNNAHSISVVSLNIANIKAEN